MKNITVLLLAGGKSERLWPLSGKHFLHFLGKPLVYYCLKQLENQGFRKIIIVVNNLNKPLFELLKGDFPNLDIRLILQLDRKGMDGAVLSAKDFIKDTGLLVIGPSDVYEDSLFGKFSKLLRKNPGGIIAGTAVSTYFPGGYLVVEGDNVTNVVEKPKPKKIPSNIVTFVFHYYKDPNNFITLLEKTKSKKDDIYELSLGKLVSGEKDFKYLPYQGFWGYLKFPWHILNLNSYFLGKIKSKKVQGVNIAKSATIIGNVVAETGVKILENTKVVGPTYLGYGTIVGNNSVVRESTLGNNCVIGAGTEISRSFIGDNCWFHINYIGDSVISDNVSMGAGAILANFRLDETVIKSKVAGKMISTGKVKLGSIIGETVRIGVNASIMPGVKIGKNSFVGAGVVLSQDLPEGKFCSLPVSSYVVNDNKAMVSEKMRLEVRKKPKL